MNKEQFGVELVAITDKFKSKMNEIKDMGQQTANRIKQAWTSTKITPQIDTSNLIKAQNATRGLSETLKQLRNFDVLDTGTIKLFSNEISIASGKAQFLRSNFKLVKPTIKEASNETEKLARNGLKATTSFSGMGKGINKIGNEIERASKRILRFGLSMLSIRSIFSLVSRASSAYLSQDTDLANKLQSAWAGLGAFLAPMIDAIATRIMKLVKYMNIFIKAVTGQDLLAKASKKATDNINKQTKATKGLNKSLSSLDEITNIQKDETTGVGGTEGENPFANFEDVEVDTTWAERIKNFGEWIKNNWEYIVVGITGIALALGALKIAGILAGVGLSGLLVPLLAVALAITGVVAVVLGIKELFKKGGNQTKAWTLILGGLLAVVIAIGIAFGLVPALIALAVAAVVAGGLWIVKNWEKVKEFFSNLWTGIKDGAGKAWDWIKSKWNEAGNWFGRLGNNIKNAFSKVWDGLKNGARNAINGIIGFMNIWIRGLNVMLTPVRGLIVAISKAFGKNVSLGDVKIPSIPKLATGTNYVPEDQLAYIHKGEAVIPKKFNSAEYFSNINDNTETNALLLDVNRTLLDILDKDTTLNINGKELARTTYNDFKNERNRLGQSSVVNVR